MAFEFLGSMCASGARQLECDSPRKTLYKRFLAAVVATAFELIYYVIHGCSLFRGNRFGLLIEIQSTNTSISNTFSMLVFVFILLSLEIIRSDTTTYFTVLFYTFSQGFVQRFFCCCRLLSFFLSSIFQDCIFNVVLQ